MSQHPNPLFLPPSVTQARERDPTDALAGAHFLLSHLRPGQPSELLETKWRQTLTWHTGELLAQMDIASVWGPEDTKPTSGCSTSEHP